MNPKNIKQGIDKNIEDHICQHQQIFTCFSQQNNRWSNEKSIASNMSNHAAHLTSMIWLRENILFTLKYSWTISTYDHTLGYTVKLRLNIKQEFRLGSWRDDSEVKSSDLVTPICNPSTKMAEAGRSWVHGQLGYIVRVHLKNLIWNKGRGQIEEIRTKTTTTHIAALAD